MALQIEPNNKEAYELLNTYSAERESEVVVEELKKLLVKDPNNKEVIYNLADIYCKIGEYELALIKIEKLLRNNPNDAMAHNILGRIYFEQGKRNPDIRDKNYKLAIDEYKKAIKAADKDPYFKGYVFLNLVYFYWAQGKMDLASEAFNKVVDYQPQNKYLWFLLRIMRFSTSSNQEPEKEILNHLLFYNLSKICEISCSRGVKLILLGYPNHYNFFQDGVRREIAEKYKIPFIDFATIFRKLLSEGKYSYRDLFLTDLGSHCNANGYRVMAEEIYKVIVSEIESKAVESN
jgi:tetratricopeptide (TPR) repeat protein